MAESPAVEQFEGVTLKSLLENPNLLQPPVPLSQSSKIVDKEKELEEWGSQSGMSADMAAAFLGPTLWDKTVTYDGNDFKLEYMDLDEFLSENGIPLNVDEILPTGKTENSDDASSTTSSDVNQESPKIGTTTSIHDNQEKRQEMISVPISPSSSPVREPSPVTVEVDFAVSPTDTALATIPGQEEFDPRKRTFTEDELKPQPMIKKSRKIFVPEDLKDDKYWERRKKNNFAAKRSRDARRVKENQIAIRASFLEKENNAFRDELSGYKKEVISLKKIIANYEKKLQMLTDKTK
ncbi:thyrotroph embryonic factor-like [Glandiceps talaboti]